MGDIKSKKRPSNEFGDGDFSFEERNFKFQESLDNLSNTGIEKE